MLSARAQQYLQTLERRAYVADIGRVKEALAARGIPLTEPLLEFHQTFAGYVDTILAVELVLGLIHESSEYCPPLEADAFEAKGVWYILCADGHPSYDYRIDQLGRFYGGGTCGRPTASSYFMKTEQDAFLREWVFSKPARYVRLEVDVEDLEQRLLPALGHWLVPELSDDFSKVFTTEAMAINLFGGFVDAWVVGDALPAELADVPHQILAHR